MSHTRGPVNMQPRTIIIGQGPPRQPAGEPWSLHRRALAIYAGSILHSHPRQAAVLTNAQYSRLHTTRRPWTNRGSRQTVQARLPETSRRPCRVVEDLRSHAAGDQGTGRAPQGHSHNHRCNGPCATPAFCPYARLSSWAKRRAGGQPGQKAKCQNPGPPVQGPSQPAAAPTNQRVCHGIRLGSYRSAAIRS